MTSRGTRWAAALAAAAALVAGCGTDDGGGGGAAEPPAAATQADFPSPGGKTIAELRAEVGPGPMLSPAVTVLEAGKRNRFAFGLFDRARTQISQAQVGLYVADDQGRGVRGPYLARWESLAVEPEFRSESVSADPAAAESVYVGELPFEKAGVYQVLGIAKLDDRLVAADPIAVEVVKKSEVPAVGEPAPRTHTPTLEDVGGVAREIDTRVPPAPELHERDFADVVGREPVVLVFATPALCQSRICGPVVDILKQVKARNEGKAVFIHMEIYKGNRLERGFRKQVLDWNLPTEPWAFAIDRDGKVAARLEGAFSVDELERALAAAVRR